MIKVSKYKNCIIATFLTLMLVVIIGCSLLVGAYYDYSTRSLILIFGGLVVIFLVYQIFKIRHKYKIRTFSEIVDKILSSGWTNQLMALLILSVIAFLFSWALIDSISNLHWNGADPLNDHQSFWLTICYFFDPGNLNITNHLNPGVQGIISLIVAILGMTILTGLFVSTFTNIIEQRVDAVKSGAITYKGIHSHFIVIGFCDLTEAIIRGIFEKQGNNSKIILLTKEKISSVRESLYEILNSKQYDGQLVLYSGDYCIFENLNRLNLSTSKEIYILGDISNENTDYYNYACYQQIDTIISKNNDSNISPIPVYVRMDNINAFSTFQRLDFNAMPTKTYCRPFNSSELWARIVWNGGDVEVCDSYNQKKVLSFPPFYFCGDDEKVKYSHFVISGFNQMSQALILQIIRSAHFSSYTEENSCNKTTITIVDPLIEELWLDFSFHFRHLEQVYDIEINRRTCSIGEIEQEIIEWCCDRNQKLILVICSDNQDVALERGLNLPTEVYYQHDRKSTELPVVLVEQKTYSLIWEQTKKPKQMELDDIIGDPKAFRKAQYDKYHNLYPFGMKIRSIYPNKIEDLKACIIHADYESQWCNMDKAPKEKVTVHHLYELVEHHEDDKLRLLLDKVFLNWFTTPENIKSANRYQTDNHKQIKLLLERNGINSMKQISKISDDLLFLCSDIEHRRWIGERVIAGWQQSPLESDGVTLRQDSLRLHCDIRKTSEIQDEINKDDNVVINVLMLDQICEYIIKNRLLNK